SNICTNQGLLVTAATIHMSLLGAEGLEHVAASCHANTRRLVELLTANDFVKPRFNRPYFHECALEFSIPLAGVIQPFTAHNLLPGYELEQEYPELKDHLLVCATETKTEADLQLYADHLNRMLEKQTKAGRPV